MKWRQLILSVLALSFVGAGASLLLQPTLIQIHKKILSTFESVEHIEPKQLVEMEFDDVLLFDVREQGEFDVSHIKGAIQVDPDIRSSDFDEQYGDLMKNKTIVFYCSVGRRSSVLASLVDDVVEDNGGQATYNLIGGIFQWHNQNRPLINLANNSTRYLHPYNKYWGLLIDDQSVVRYAQ